MQRRSFLGSLAALPLMAPLLSLLNVHTKKPDLVVLAVDSIVRDLETPDADSPSYHALVSCDFTFRVRRDGEVTIESRRDGVWIGTRVLTFSLGKVGVSRLTEAAKTIVRATLKQTPHTSPAGLRFVTFPICFTLICPADYLYGGPPSSRWYRTTGFNELTGYAFETHSEEPK